jgi:putative ABC transport system permease protein
MSQSTAGRGQFADRAYRAMLRLYPQSFRERFGEEMVELFHARRHASAARGPGGRAAFWLRATLDTCGSVLRERLPDGSALRRAISFRGAETNMRDALRVLRRSPATTLTIVLLMMLTIGAATSVFSVVNAALIRPLPYGDPERLVAVWESRPERGVERNNVSGHEFPAWEEQNRVFERMAALTFTEATLTGAGEPRALTGVRATSGFFSVMAVRPLVGRGFLPQEDVPGHGQVVVLSERLWRERFGADLHIAGRRILLDDQPFEVVGVVPDTFNFPPVVLGTRVDYWSPIAEPIRNYRGRHYLYVVARLKHGVSIEQARADMSRVAGDLRKQFPDLNRGHEARVLPLQGDLMRDARASLLLLLGAVSCLLLIGCSNVAGLLLARGLARHHEIGVRLAIGGTRLDVARQLLTESVILSACGAILGVTLTYWFTQTIPSLVPRDVLAIERVPVDQAVLAFALVTSIGTGLLFGLAPSLQVRHINVGAVLQQAGRTILSAGNPRSRRVLVGVQVAVTLVLVLAAGVMTRGLLAIQAVDPGYVRSGLLAVDLALPGSRYPDAIRQRQFLTDLMARGAAIPGVVSIAATNATPLDGRINGISVDIEGRPLTDAGQDRSARYRVVTTDYFRTLAIPVLSGRTFAGADARIAVPIMRWFPQQPQPAGFDRPQPPPVAVVNAAMARQFWPDVDPVGRRFRALFSSWITVVGVVANTHNYSLRDPAVPEFYLHDLQEPQASMSLLVRSAGEPTDLTPLIRSTIRDLDSSLAIKSVRTMEDVVRSTFGLPRLTSAVVGAFALMALGLMAAGVYGLMAFTTAQRLPELSIRMALGAEPGQVLLMIVRQGFSTAAIGMIAGLAAAVALVRGVGSQLFGAPTIDPLTWIGATVLLALAILAACWWPAQRASRVDPSHVLRQ